MMILMSTVSHAAYANDASHRPPLSRQPQTPNLQPHTVQMFRSSRIDVFLPDEALCLVKNGAPLKGRFWFAAYRIVHVIGFIASLTAALATLPPAWFASILGRDERLASKFPALTSLQLVTMVMNVTLESLVVGSTCLLPAGPHTVFGGAFNATVMVCAVLSAIVPVLRVVHASFAVPLILFNSFCLFLSYPTDPLTVVVAMSSAVCGMKVTVEQDKKLLEHFLKTTLVRDEISRSMTIIRNLLPRHVIQQLVHQPMFSHLGGNLPSCDEFDSVSILFADIVGFTPMSALVTPQQLIDMLNSIFTCFDGLAMKHSVYKVETIGDCYFCASGLPNEDKYHADHIVDMALDMQKVCARITHAACTLTILNP